MPVPARAQVRTCRLDGSDPQWVRPVNLKWSYAMPGGADQLSFLVQAPADERPSMIGVGRRVQVFPTLVSGWEGQLDEPSPGIDGWQVTAHGAGTFGGQYQADYTGHTWGAHSVDDAISNAIARTPGGLRWVKGAGVYPLPDGAWLGQAPDQGNIKIGDLLNLVCSRGGLTWQVTSGPGGNTVSIVPLPVKVTRLLVATGPVGRTLAGVVNAVCIRYCSKADGTGTTGTPAVYDTTWAENAALIGEYGRNEEPLDLSDAGVMTGGAAAAVGQKILLRYVQAAFGGPFTVTPGQYLTTTGTRVTLACETAGEVARLLLTDYGGVAVAGPVTFPVGGYEYDEESGTAVVTPFGSVRTDWAALVASMTGYRTVKGDPLGLKAGL